MEVAKSDPQLAYCAYVFGTSKRWQFVSRTTPGISEPLKKLEELIRSKLIPAIVGKEYCSDELRLIFRLPARLGGLGLLNPSEESNSEHVNSTIATANLKDAIYNQQDSFITDVEIDAAARKEVTTRKSDSLNLMQEELKGSISYSLYKIIQLSAEKSASSWLTSVPLREYGFHLNKQQFCDALCMRYDFRLHDVNRNTSPFVLDHDIYCMNNNVDARI